KPALPPDATFFAFGSEFAGVRWLLTQYRRHFSITSFGKMMPASWQARIPSAPYCELELSVRCPSPPSFVFFSTMCLVTSGLIFTLGSIGAGAFFGLNASPLLVATLGGPGVAAV